MDHYNELNRWAGTLDPNDIGALSTRQELTGKERKFMYDAARKLRRRDPLSVPQLRFLKSIMEKVNMLDRTEHKTEHDLVRAAQTKIGEVRHLTVRMAWHDSAWNGRICKDPAANSYCVGEHSLLSDRIRKRRNLNIECKEECRASSANAPALENYLPPCFWSINAFSPTGISVSHDNPAAEQFPPIKDELPPYSVFSWPFKLSFVRGGELTKYGKYYPKPIFESRIQKFQNCLRENKSLVFLYCNYSNPVSGEDYKYLLVGCAFLSEKGRFVHFEPTESQLKAKQKQYRMQNFPTLNWALRYTLDIERTGIRGAPPIEPRVCRAWFSVNAA
jgi:exodeoxyribonuclease V alpha subunit